MDLLTIKQASIWATQYLEKNITASNISYLIQYGKVKKYHENNTTVIRKSDLMSYYKSYDQSREIAWKQKLGQDLNWNLSFDKLKEKDTTKHVHRLHPYKGKFIPQLVNYFLDSHTDDFKQEVYFEKGDIVLDPFCGSGTTMVQASELGIHAIGIDISPFNALIANVKISKVAFAELRKELNRITTALQKFILENNNSAFENELLEQLNQFNKTYFPSPEYRIRVAQGEVNEKEYSPKLEIQFSQVFNKLKEKYQIKIQKEHTSNFLEKWYLEPVRKEIDFTFEQIKKIENSTIKKIISVILSRTMRSCRATTHADLATLKEPVTQTYYCKKHGKICKPLFSMLSWWIRYAKDTLNRLHEFDKLRTQTWQRCLQGDARNIDLLANLEIQQPNLAALLKQQKIKGVFSSPPYVGLINYHEQHAYAYDLFGFARNDDLEIGPLFKGQGKQARQSYTEGIAQVLKNSKKYLQSNYDIFLVANDKYNLYPTIAERAKMKIVYQHKRPVLNRTEKNKGAYSEIIFHLKEM